jgi:membrane protease YdiL (CAAX protease family)
MPPSGQVAARAVALGGFYTAQVGVLAFLAHRHGSMLPEAFGLRSRDRVGPGAIAGATGLVALLLLATRAASTAWGALAQAAGWMPPPTEALTAVFGGGGLGLGLAVAMVVVVAPFAEELAFRGVIARALSGRFGARAGIIGSAAVFSAYHGTAWVLVPTFVLGCALAWLALTRRSLWPAITLHALYNAVVVAAAFWLPVAA